MNETETSLRNDAALDRVLDMEIDAEVDAMPIDAEVDSMPIDAAVVDAMSVDGGPLDALMATDSSSTDVSIADAAHQDAQSVPLDAHINATDMSEPTDSIADLDTTVPADASAEVPQNDAAPDGP